MDKWIKAGVIGTYLCFGSQLWYQLKTPSAPGSSGGAHMNYIPAMLTVASALMVSAAALLASGKWPFHRWKKSGASVPEKSDETIVFTIFLDQCRLLLNEYRNLGSADPANTKKPLSSSESWPLPGRNHTWTYTQLNLFRLSADYGWLHNTAKWAFKEMGCHTNIPFFNEIPSYMAEVLAHLEGFERILESKIAALEAQK